MNRWLALALVAAVSPTFAASPTPLSSADVKALVAAPATGSKVLALWSLDCAYCEENLAALRRYQRQHADGIELVYVATDPMAQAPALEARLARAKLGDVPSRAYTDATPDRLNFLIDPTWGGETPRTVVIHADGSRKTYSGALTAERIEALIHL
ncbi:hypothetical protein [Luteibacter yeojuensis]|uniref:Signal peptide protein n=1 Tax=Luteibacter yeojuensis TaxID=345309 RepID=A0A0F3K5Q7_9GAMM|nr:hypothetical protein [Luteibacter yeojuensis]KJV25434.1 signal peptide protein [Luteibacter yeojuensis]